MKFDNEITRFAGKSTTLLAILMGAFAIKGEYVAVMLMFVFWMLLALAYSFMTTEL